MATEKVGADSAAKSALGAKWKDEVGSYLVAFVVI